MSPDAPAPLVLVPVPGTGPEDVLVAPDGSALTGTEDGAVWQVSADGARTVRVGVTPGRPLGLEWLPDGRVLVCDAHAGLLALDLASGRTETLLDRVEGRPLGLCNNAAVAADGTVYLTDSTTRYSLDRWKVEFVEDTRTGRLLRRDPDGSVAVLRDGLRFANGVALAADESFVCVAETVGRRVLRHWLTGPRAGEEEPLVEDLPGYPDNLARGTDGLLWVTVASPRDPVLEVLLRAPLPVRQVVARLPAAVQPRPRRTARVLALDDMGRVVHDLDRDASDFFMATGVREHEGRVWLGSLMTSAVAWFER